MDYRDFFLGCVNGLAIHRNGQQAYGICPLHEDRVKSFSINLATSQWYCHAGCGAGNALTLARRLGIPPPSSGNERPEPSTSPIYRAPAEVERPAESAGIISKKIVATYTYRDENGSPLFRVQRFDPKGFFQQRFENGQWVTGLGETRRALYNLPAVLAATSFIILVEGEKDADRLMDSGFVATTAPMGAGKWTDDYSAALKGKRVVILPDNDEPGEIHATTSARSILAAGGSVKIVRLPGLPPKGDVSDFFNAGGSSEKLIEIIKATPLFGQAVHSTEAPVEYFRRHGCEMNDGALRLPTEFKPLCKESYRQFTSLARHVTEAVQEQISLAEQIWQSCRTRNQYDTFLRTLKKAHELSLVDQ